MRFDGGVAHKTTGKSTLASVIIDEAKDMIRQARKEANSTVIFFYCKDGVAERNTFISVVRSLLYQLSFGDNLLTEYLDAECSSSGETTLVTVALARKLLDVLVRSKDNVFVVIDGLDECLAKEKSTIVSSFRSLASMNSWTPRGDSGDSEESDESDASDDKSCALQCLFVSQEDADCVRILRDIPVVRIRPEDNERDIRIFCKHWEDAIRDNHDAAGLEAGLIANRVAMISKGKGIHDTVELS